jgi:hypothetical protein
VAAGDVAVQLGAFGNGENGCMVDGLHLDAELGKSGEKILARRRQDGRPLSQWESVAPHYRDLRAKAIASRAAGCLTAPSKLPQPRSVPSRCPSNHMKTNYESRHHFSWLQPPLSACQPTAFAA